VFATAATWSPASQCAEIAFRLEGAHVRLALRRVRSRRRFWRPLTRFEVEIGSLPAGKLRLRPAAFVAYALSVHAVAEDSAWRRALLVARHWLRASRPAAG
jgi:hypothetical protein